MHDYLKKLLPLKQQSFIWQGLAGNIFKTGTPGKPVLVLQHGLTGDHRGLILLAHQLKNTFELYLTELPGHGQSPMPPQTVDLQDLAGWFGAAVQHLAPQPYVLAHSFGCSVALRVLAHTPQAMKHCVLVNPVPRTASSVQLYHWAGSKIPYSLSHRLDANRIIRELKMKTMFERTEKAEQLAELFLPRIGAFDHARAQLYLHLGKQVQRDVIYQDPLLGQLWSKVSAIIGPHDKLLSAAAKKELANLIPKQNIIAIPRTGHLTPIEAPEETAEAVQRLLK